MSRSFQPCLILVVGVLIGAVAARIAAPRPEIPLHALATHGNDTMAICTVPIDGNNEGLATLDFLTGELRIVLVHPKSRKITMKGVTSVLADLEIAKGKKVNLLMVCGQTKFVPGADAAVVVPSPATLYVCDANSGKYVAYGIGTVPGALAAGVPVELAIKKFEAGLTRELNLDE